MNTLFTKILDARVDYEKSQILSDSQAKNSAIQAAELCGGECFTSGVVIVPALLASVPELSSAWQFGWTGAKELAFGKPSEYVVVCAVHPSLGELYWDYCYCGDTNSPDYYGFTTSRSNASPVRNGWRTDNNLWIDLPDGLPAYMAQRFVASVLDDRNDYSEYRLNEDEDGRSYGCCLTGSLAALQEQSSQTPDDFVRWLIRAEWSDVQVSVVRDPHDSDEFTIEDYLVNTSNISVEAPASEIAPNTRSGDETQPSHTTGQAIVSPIVGFTALPAHLHGLANAAFKMAENGENPDDVLRMLSHGLRKSKLDAQE